MSNRNHGKRVGIVLFQLGGPDSLEAVEPFLYNLFSDPDIIQFPFARLARPTLAQVFSSRRARRVQQHYASIGGKSPLRERTEQQAAALENELQKTLDARVFVAMRYWHPRTEEAVERVRAADCRELVLLPLYPQYSKTTTASSLNEWKRKYLDGSGNAVPAKVVGQFYDHPIYLEALAEKINLGFRKFGIRASDVHLIFSAHGVPVSSIEAGDPYQAQVEATVNLVRQRGGWANPAHLCYQSRVGPGRWLEPALDETLRELATKDAERVLVVPISFVSDHVETLHEIDIEARELAASLGIRQFESMPALNDSPKFIQALADLVLREVGVKARESSSAPAE